MFYSICLFIWLKFDFEVLLTNIMFLCKCLFKQCSAGDKFWFGNMKALLLILLLSLCVIKGKNTKSEQLINKCYQPTFFVSMPQWVTGCENSFARHFNRPNHSYKHKAVCGISLHDSYGEFESRKSLDQKFSSALNPHDIDERFSFH